MFIPKTKMNKIDMVFILHQELGTAAPLQTLKGKIKDNNIFNFSCFSASLRKIAQWPENT